MQQGGSQSAPSDASSTEREAGRTKFGYLLQDSSCTIHDNARRNALGKIIDKIARIVTDVGVVGVIGAIGSSITCKAAETLSSIYGEKAPVFSWHKRCTIALRLLIASL